MSHKRSPNPKGITLILAIMIMSAVVAIGITLSTVLVFQVRLNKVVKEGHQGYYGTESGMELGLNLINTLKSGTITAALDALKNATLPDSSPQSSLDAENSAFFSGTPLSASSQPTSSAASQKVVQENQSVFVELYNVDNSLNTINPTTDFTSPALCIYAEGLDTDVGGADTAGNEVLEVSWVAWGTSLSLSRTQKVLVSFSSFNSTADCAVPGTTDRGFSVPITQFYPAFTGTPFAGFRVRITPLAVTTSPHILGAGDVANLAVYTNPPVTSQIQLKSVSSAAGQKQALSAILPWSLPLSGLFDFVIFSDKKLEKNVPVQIAQDLRRYGPFTAVDGVLTAISPLTAFTDPTPDCSVAAPCTYYLRLKDNDVLPVGWSAVGATVNITSPNSANVEHTINTLNATSCILTDPFIIKDATGVNITFTSKPAKLAQYELLTRPAFSTSNEDYCP